MMKLGELMFEPLSEALGLEPNHLKERDCAKSLSLLSHYYPPCPEPDRTFGISSHKDISFITVLLQDHIGGPQVLHDGCWIDLISNDKFVSVEHMILANRSEEPRISIASFFMHTIPNEQEKPEVLPFSLAKNNITDEPVNELEAAASARGTETKYGSGLVQRFAEEAGKTPHSLPDIYLSQRSETKTAISRCESLSGLVERSAFAAASRESQYFQV
ncbi:hypothetical protein DY000_02034874 [Brassica cretica]|uniref:Fe2OG dioxygenase domain-containing protein n=1 Tax=Brassica cretica TaxID=69181 RepID=A0ABQ7DMK0_BRACR|nr:hypothetical protein DY000_02034874 [Brassica cretica]